MKPGIKRIVKNALEGYSNKPEVEYWNDAVKLKGGHWAAREDVEKALDKRGHVDAIQNRPAGKTIYIK